MEPQQDGIPVADPQATLESLRKQVEAEVAEKHQADIDKAVDEALVRYHGRHAKDIMASGSFELDDRFAAHAASNVLSERWTPLLVQSNAKGKITNVEVQNAVNDYLSGFPVIEGNNVMAFNTAASQERLFKAMKSATQKAVIDPTIVSVVKMLTNYIFGRRVLVGCSHHRKVDLLLHDFWAQNRMDRRLKAAISKKIITGEHYFFYFINTDGGITIRDSVRPWQIQNIETHTEDAETRLSYERLVKDDLTRKENEYYPDIGYNEQLNQQWGQASKYSAKFKPNIYVQMVKYGSLSDVRGVTPLYSVLRYSKYWEDFLTDRIILNHERSKVVWVKVIKSQGSGEFSRSSLGPKSGQVLTETPQLEWKAISANINASDAKEDGRIIRLMIGTGSGLPEHILFHDASQAVYSSIRNHDTPHAQNIRSHQDDWVYDLRDMARTVIHHAVLARKLPPTTKQEIVTLESWQHMYYELKDMIAEKAKASEIRNTLQALMKESDRTMRVIKTENVEVDIKFPDPVQEDPLKQAQRAEVLYRINVASLPEIAGWVGLNWWEQNEMQQKAGGWPEYKPAPSNGQTDSKPGELTTTDPIDAPKEQ